MEEQSVTSEKKSFLQNDRLLVCSMLVFYGVCIIGLIAATFFGLNRREQTLSVNATSTAAVSATEQANATSTAIARLAEQDKYEYIERFDKISGDWIVGDDKGQYGDVTMSIKDGVYIWKIDDAKGYIQGTDFYRDGNNIRNFDVYVDLKFVETAHTGEVCSGLLFRESDGDWTGGVYIFYVCDNAHFDVQYVKGDDWQTIKPAENSSLIRTTDWNRLGISAIDNHFMLTINSVQVFDMLDDSVQEGGLGLYIAVPDKTPTEIWFDNFGYQAR